MYLNNSRCSTMDDCPREYFWSYVFRNFGIRGKWLDEKMAFGSLVHYGLAHLYAGENLQVCTERAEAEWREEYKFDDLPFDEKNLWLDHFDWAGRILQSYDIWRQEKDDFEPLQVETEGSVILGEVCYACGKEYPQSETPWTQCPFCGEEVHHWVFRVDLAVARFGKVYIIDHKTAGSVSEPYLASWHYSPQLRGYAYGYGKALGAEVSGVGANIIRKLKTIGQDVPLTKQCPACRAGKKKVLTCETCNATGKVPRKPKKYDSPFLREWESFDPDQAEHFVRMRLRTAQDIKAEYERFEVEPDAAWPMTPGNCFNRGRCPFVKLCWEGCAERWYDPPEDFLESYVEKTEDYVSVREMIKEEMR